MEQILQESIKLGLPIILDDTRAELTSLIKRVNPKNILEIGSAIGYSASCMLSVASKNATLTTIEIDPERYKLCKKNLARVAGNRALVINADAGEFLKMYNGRKFDFVFIDGPKGQYQTYVNLLMPNLNDGAYLFCDNIYFHGMVNGKIPVSRGVRTMVRNLSKFIETMKASTSFETQILEKGDGILIAKYVK